MADTCTYMDTYSTLGGDLQLKLTSCNYCNVSIYSRKSK